MSLLQGSSAAAAYASANLLYGYIGGLIPLVLYLSVRTVNSYAEADFPRHTYLTLYVAFFSSFTMFGLIPLDVGSSVRDRDASAQDGSHSRYKDDTSLLHDIYFAFYVILLIWTNVVLAMQEYYNTDGYFTPGTRGRSSFRRWANDTVPAIVIGLILLGVLIGMKEVPSSAVGLKTTLVTMTTLIFETILMFLLGYGYIELPKSLWKQGSTEAMLLKMQAKAATDFVAFQAAQMDCQKQASSVLKTKEKVGSGGEPQVQEALAIMLAECPQEFKSARMGDVAADKAGKVTIDTLAALRTRLNITKAAYRMAQARLENTQMGAYICEDLVDAKNRNNRRHDRFDGQRVIKWQLRGCDSTENEYRWLLLRRPLLCRFSAVVLGLLSFFCIIGAICSIKGVPRPSSPFFAIVHAPTNRRGGIMFFVALTFGYTVVVALWALLQLKSLGFELVKGRTTPYSLSAFFRMVASLAFPLTFFYLGWVGENGIDKDGNDPWMYFSVPRNVTFATTRKISVPAGLYYTNETHYVPKSHHNVTVQIPHNRTESVVVPSMSWTSVPDYMPAAFAKFYILPASTHTAFGTIYPAALIIFLLLFITQAYNRLMVCFKMPAYQFGDPVVTKEQLDEGNKNLNKYRKIAQRTVQRHEAAKKRAEKDANRSIRLFGCLIWRRETLKEMEDRLDRKARKEERKNRPPSSGTGSESPKSSEELMLEQGQEMQRRLENQIQVNIPQPAPLSGTGHIRIPKPSPPSTDPVAAAAPATEAKLVWVEVYLEVRAPGTLYVLKDINHADADPPILDEALPKPLILETCSRFKDSSKADKEGRVVLRIDGAVGASTREGEGGGKGKGEDKGEPLLKVRLANAEDAKKWAALLDEWKAYSIQYKIEVETIKEQRLAEMEKKADEEAHARFYAVAPSAGDGEGTNPGAGGGSPGGGGAGGRRRTMSTALNPLGGLAASVFKPKEPMTINPMRLAGRSAARYDVNAPTAVPNADVNLEIKPDAVEGWLELKSFTPVWFGSKYKRYYFRIDEATSSMQYFHDEIDCDGSSPVGFLDLTEASEAVVSTKYKDERDLERFSCRVDRLVYYFKAPHAPEAKLWIRLINLWREYLLIRYAHKTAARVFAVQERISASAKLKAETDAAESADTRSGEETADTVALTVVDSTTTSGSAASDSDKSTGWKQDEEKGENPEAETGPVPTPRKRLSLLPLPSSAAPPADDRGHAVGLLKRSPRRSQALSPALLRASGIVTRDVEMGGIGKAGDKGGSEEEKEPGGGRGRVAGGAPQ